MIGIKKELLNTKVSNYLQLVRAGDLAPNEELKEALEKVHYALQHDTPIRKKYVYKVFPDIDISNMVPHQEAIDF